MKIIYGINRAARFRNPVVVMGVFDGVHRAHAGILRSAARFAKGIKGTSIVVTFWPHPQAEESLYSLEHRMKLFSEIGLDVCVVVNFNRGFSRLNPRDFIARFISGKLNAKYLYVGRNFTFGRNASGDWRLLKSLSAIYNYKLRLKPVMRLGEGIISSTRIRKLIKRGRFPEAGKLLGRPVSILGTVIKGSSLARKLGFPTANINPHHEVLPPPGVYMVKVILDERKFYGVCSIGNKPTFAKNTMQHIEVHILNFKKNIYSRDLEVIFIKKIRNQKKFRTLAELALQIKKDIILSKKRFSLP